MPTSSLIPLGPKEPPKNGTTQRRLREYLLDKNATFMAGSSTLDAELRKKALPPAGRPRRSEAIALPEEFKAEIVRIEKRSYENAIFLASWDFMGKAGVRPGEDGILEVVLDGVPTPFPAPEGVEEAVARLITKKIDTPAPRDEILLEAEAMEIQFVVDLGMDPDKHAATLQVIDVVANVVAVPLYALKHRLDIRRPHEVDPEVLPIIPVPGHASYPGGHSAYAKALAIVLSALTGAVGDEARRLDAVATQIGNNRELAGLHTDLDTDAGIDLGSIVGVWMASVGVNPDINYPTWAVLFAKATTEWLR